MTVPPQKRPWRRRMTRLLVLVGVVVGLWIALSYAAVYRLTRRHQPPYPEPVPALAWGTATPLRLTAGDGEELGAWFIDGRPDRPVVVLLHGNGGCRTSCLAPAELVASAGSPVLLLTFRAHGDSTGEDNDFGYGGRHDVAAAVGWVAEKYPGRPVVVWGQSLGSAAALFAAEGLGDRVRGYVLECPYRDLRTATRNRTRMVFPPVLEAVAYAGLTTTAPLILQDVDAISPVEAAGRVPKSARALVLAGGADLRATPDEARAIAERLGDRAELVVVPGADHLRLSQTDPATYRSAILGFLESCR